MENTKKVLDDIEALVPMGGVTVPDNKLDLHGLYKRRDFVVEKAKSAGLKVIEMKESKENPCPFLAITFPEMVVDGKLKASIALVGHMDVVDGKEGQFKTKIEGDYISGRGTTDMLAVDATYLEWMIDRQKKGGKKPPFLLMLSFTEENISALGHNIASGKEYLENEFGADFEFAIVGERTGEMEKSDSPVIADIRDSNYGLRRFQIDSDLKEVNPENSAKIIDVLAKEMIAKTRSILINANNQDRQTTTFANSFLDFNSGIIFERTKETEFMNFTIDADGSTKHSANSKPEDETPLEVAYGFIDALRKRDFKFNLLRLKAGQKGNYNMVSKAFSMDFVLGNLDEANRDFLLDEAQNRKGTLKYVNDPKYNSQKKLSTGIEIRESPLHSKLIEELRRDFTDKLAELGKAEMSFPVNLEGWVCDQSNPHLIKSRNAYELVSGLESKPKSKKFFNDGDKFIFPCDGHTHEGHRIARAIVWGQTGFAPHGDAEKHYIPSIDTGWKTLDALADQYLTE